MAWLSMPGTILRLFQNNMAKLQAREALMTFKAVALGFGSMEKEMAESMLRAWIKAAELDGGETKGKSPEQLIVHLGAMGIAVKYDG